jgi:hypothetical protein
MGYAVLTPPLPPARVAHMISPAVLSASNFARKALATRARKVSKYIGSVGGCVLGAGWGGRSLKAPTQRSERSTRLPQAQRLVTTYKRLVPNPNTATPLLMFTGAHMRGLGASGATMVRWSNHLRRPGAGRRFRRVIWPLNGYEGLWGGGFKPRPSIAAIVPGYLG